MIRLGTVLVFKKDATRAEIVKALESIRHVIDVPKVHPQWAGDQAGMVHSMHHELNDFDPAWGEPVWYIP